MKRSLRERLHDQIPATLSDQALRVIAQWCDDVSKDPEWGKNKMWIWRIVGQSCYRTLAEVLRDPKTLDKPIATVRPCGHRMPVTPKMKKNGRAA